jgi:heptosyltransferase-2
MIAPAQPLRDAVGGENRREVSLVIQTSHLGDTVLTTPLIARLAERGQVDVVTAPRGAGILRNHPAIRTLVLFDKDGGDGGLRGLLRTAARLRQIQERGTAYDAAYLAQGSVRSAVLALLAGVRERVGFDTSAGALLYTTRVRYRAEVHHAVRLWELAGPEPVEPRPFAPRVYASDADARAADELLRGFPADRPLLVLAPGSRRATKCWPHFEQLARELGAFASVVVIGGAEDRAAGEAIRSARRGNPTVNLAGTLTPLGSAAVIQRADAVVCNDSAAQHMAAAVGVPVIAVFGPTLPSWGFGPLSPDSTVLEAPRPLPCRPCAKQAPHACPEGHWRCMREISPEAVVHALQALLARSPQRAASST